jgi:hypothetical protein
MKIRTGFVSNSSSSSFVVAFPAKFVMNAENVKNYLFADWDPTTTFDTEDYFWDEGDGEESREELAKYDVQDGKLDLLGAAKVIAETLGTSPTMRLPSNDIYAFNASNEDGGLAAMLYDVDFFKSVPHGSDF